MYIKYIIQNKILFLSWFNIVFKIKIELFETKLNKLKYSMLPNMYALKFIFVVN